MLFKSTGILRYSNDPYRLVLDVDPEISRYYRSMVPKIHVLNPQKFAPHVTVVRAEHEVPLQLDAWGRYEGESVDFEYEPTIYHGTIYFWLNVFCTRLEDIRKELCLP
jgi:hypothetical protein